MLSAIKSNFFPDIKETALVYTDRKMRNLETNTKKNCYGM